MNMEIHFLISDKCFPSKKNKKQKKIINDYLEDMFFIVSQFYQEAIFQHFR